jgi:SnoaL-like domain
VDPDAPKANDDVSVLLLHTLLHATLRTRYLCEKEPAMPVDWDARIQLMWDRQEIERLLFTYCRGVDRQDLEVLKSVYHEDAIDEHGYFVGTAHEFAEHVIARMAVNTTYGQHQISNALIEVDGDRAICESSYWGFHKVPPGWESLSSFFGEAYAEKAKADGTLDQTHEYLCGGRYLDNLERRGGVWKIAHRRITVEWSQSGAATEQTDGARAALNLPGTRDKTDPLYALRM